MNDNTYKCNIIWSKNGRNKPVPPNFRYACTTYIKGINHMLSISIDFEDTTDTGTLRFLRPDLVKYKQLINTSFFLLEGDKLVGIGTFI